MALKPVDDFDESVKGVEHVAYGYKGEAYGIDLNPANREAFDKLMQPYIERSVPYGAVAQENGQRASRPARTNAPSTQVTRVKGLVVQIADGASYDDVRAWARKSKRKISDRGRLPNEIITAYNEAHANK